MEDVLSHLMRIIGGGEVTEEEPASTVDEQTAQYREACEILESLGAPIHPVDFLNHLDGMGLTEAAHRQRLLFAAIKVESQLESLETTNATVH